MNITSFKRIQLILSLSVLLTSNLFAQQFTMEQTLSDGAQRNTIAFDGLAFFTGSLGADSFFPPGKVADFWGFQYLRDNDPSELGHNTDFLTKAALNMLYVLTEDQQNQLIALAKVQVASINQYGYDRFVLMKAFRRLLENDLPAGAYALDIEAVKNYSAQLYMLDGKISYERAKVMGAILRELNAEQRTYLDAMVGKGMIEWPDVEQPEILKGMVKDEKVAVMTYSGDLFSWYAGDLDADVYFCPERQGTYFGSFYLKDAPAVGNPNYTIESNITQDYGNYFLETLNSDAADSVKDLVNIQKPYLFEIVDRREDVSRSLRKFIAGETPDSLEVIELMKRYGELDGMIVYHFATCFANVHKTLNGTQIQKLQEYRTELIGDLNPTGAYLYAQAIEMPEISNTDFLFTGTSSVDANSIEPAKFSLYQNYPNPFNPQTTISYNLEHYDHVKLSVFNSLGQRIQVLTDKYQEAGYHSAVFVGRNLSSGLYLYKLEIGNKVEMKKMILIQ